MAAALTRMVPLHGALVFSLVAASSLAASPSSAAAQQLPVVNGTVTSQPAGSPFSDAFRTMVAAAVEPGWIAYTVPVVDRDRFMRDSVGGDGRGSVDCRLEPSGSS